MDNFPIINLCDEVDYLDYKKKCNFLIPLFLIFLLVSSCNDFELLSILGGSGASSGDDYSEVVLSSSWTAYNDCDSGPTGNHANATNFNDDTSGLLKDITTGIDTTVTADMDSLNISPWSLGGTYGPGMPAFGTDAYNTFNSFITLDQVVSYGSDSPWYSQVTFSDLDPAKEYAFVTTANRNNTYDPQRWTKFVISGADTYTNISSSGVNRVSDDVVKLNCYNSVRGYVVAWTGITAADGTFTVRSENVGAEGPGEEYKAYGIQGFKFMELSD